MSEGGSSFACKLDDGAFEPCVSPKTYNAVAAGSHTFSVRATDAATNIGSPETYSWTIDTTAPTTSINQKPANPSNESSPSFAFTASESGGQFECRLDTGGFAPCVSAKSYAGLADGSHTFAVRSTDPAGNLGLPESYTWVVDTVAPAAAINVKPQNPTNDSSPTFAFAAGEPTQFHCKIAAAFEPCSSPLTYPDLPDGSHTFVVKATDLAGNPGAEAQYTWIDRHRCSGCGNRVAAEQSEQRHLPGLLLHRRREREHVPLQARRGGVRQLLLTEAARRPCARSAHVRGQGHGPGGQHRSRGDLRVDDRHLGADGRDHAGPGRTEQRQLADLLVHGEPGGQQLRLQA